jgi:hypothetical protein
MLLGLESLKLLREQKPIDFLEHAGCPGWSTIKVNPDEKLKFRGGPSEKELFTFSEVPVTTDQVVQEIKRQARHHGLNIWTVLRWWEEDGSLSAEEVKNVTTTLEQDEGQ